MSEETDMERRHWYVSGDVQGVGFRYRAMRAADALGLTGWVRNCCDGRVELEVQGPAGQIERMLPRIEQGLYIEIEHVDEKIIPVCSGEGAFGVRY